MKVFTNGAIIQQKDSPTNYITVSNINYLGVNSFDKYPLCDFLDDEARILTQEVFSKEIEDNLYQSLELISSLDLLQRYVMACKKRNIAIRVLFVESGYELEKWEDPLPKMNFIGYEYCEIPFDSQIITDLDWYQPLKKFHTKLNRYGIFDTLESVLQFKEKYDEEIDKGNIGDGEMDTFVCKIYEINAEDIFFS